MAYKQAFEDSNVVVGAPRKPSLSLAKTNRPFIHSHASKLIFSIFGLIKKGRLQVQLTDGSTFVFGNDDSPLRANLHVNHPLFFDRLLKDGSLGLGESYLDGWWDVKHNRLVELIGILLCNRLDEKVKGNLRLSLRTAAHRILHSPNTIASSQRCIKHHYDLGNDFYELFLDPSMTYSCGYQKSKTNSLEQMQQQKYDLINNKLRLEKGGFLLDIGCGWGGMLIQAAKNYSNLHCTGITISEEQYTFAKKRIEQAKLSNRVDIKLLDYRQLSGSYDYIVSIGMFEHVGKKQYHTFMQQISKLLKPDGCGLLHTIGLTDPAHIKTDPWIEKYIFPGGRLPRLEEIIYELQRANLTPAHVENLRPHYATTLKLWRENFYRNISRIRKLGPTYDNRFLRMWNYYLQCCEATFRYSSNQLYQVLFCRSNEWPFHYCLSK